MNPAFEQDTPRPLDVLAAHKITVESVFVPFSQSRSKDQDTPNLNWKVTVKRDGRDVLTTDYSAGLAHAPGYNRPTPAGWNPAAYRNALCAFECESGYAGRLSNWQRDRFETIGGRPGSSSKTRRIEPNPVDVLYSLTMDSDVLDAGGFEEWAANFGYDTDSRKAESIYRACLEIALQMRAGFGNDTMQELQTAFQDY